MQDCQQQQQQVVVSAGSRVPAYWREYSQQQQDGLHLAGQCRELSTNSAAAAAAVCVHPVLLACAAKLPVARPLRIVEVGFGAEPSQGSPLGEL